MNEDIEKAAKWLRARPWYKPYLETALIRDAQAMELGPMTKVMLLDILYK